MIDSRFFLVVFITLSACQQDSFTDPRDGQLYQLMEVGNQTWLKENLRYMPDRNARQTENLNYGTYYTWDLAKTACPDGFHLPRLEEWMERMSAYEGSANPRGGVFVHKNAKDSTLLYGGMFNEGQLIANGRMGLYWTATDSTNTFGEEGGELKPAYLGIHVYGDYSIKDSINVEPTWSNSKERLFNCKCIKD